VLPNSVLFRSAFLIAKYGGFPVFSGGIGRQLAWATDIETIASPRKARRSGLSGNVMRGARIAAIRNRPLIGRISSHR
jgi:hypothetical protein